MQKAQTHWPISFKLYRHIFNVTAFFTLPQSLSAQDNEVLTAMSLTDGFCHELGDVRFFYIFSYGINVKSTNILYYMNNLI